jgi:hypothetical protein
MEEDARGDLTEEQLMVLRRLVRFGGGWMSAPQIAFLFNLSAPYLASNITKPLTDAGLIIRRGRGVGNATLYRASSKALAMDWST